MSSSSVTRKSLGLFGILGGFLCEAAAALPFVAPEVIWVSADQSFLVHLLGVVLFGGGASALISGGRSFGQWVGPAVLFTLLSLVLPILGLLMVLILTIILISHHAQLPQEEISLVEVAPVRTNREGSLYGPGPISQPLVSLLSSEEDEELRKIVLGQEGMPPEQTRPILHKLQKHPDVRVQLYANGLLNDQLDAIERQLADLKQRTKEHPSDEVSQTAIVEVYLYLFQSRLIASDEILQTAAQALRETELSLAFNPSNTTVLEARFEFQLMLGQFREAAITVEQLRHTAGREQKVARLRARLEYDQAAAQNVFSTPAPPASLENQRRSAL